MWPAAGASAPSGPGERQRRRRGRRRLGPGPGLLVGRLGGPQLGAQTRKGRVGLDVGRIDHQALPVEQAGLGALGQHLGEQLLEDRRVGKAHALGVREGGVVGQGLGEPVAEEAADRDRVLGHLEGLAHRADPAQGGHQEQFHEDARVDPGAAEVDIEGPRRLAHRVPAHQGLDPAQQVIGRRQLVRADHLQLAGLFSRAHGDRHDYHPDSEDVMAIFAAAPDAISLTGS